MLRSQVLRQLSSKKRSPHILILAIELAALVRWIHLRIPSSSAVTGLNPEHTIYVMLFHDFVYVVVTTYCLPLCLSLNCENVQKIGNKQNRPKIYNFRTRQPAIAPSYKHSTIVVYDSRVVLWANLESI